MGLIKSNSVIQQATENVDTGQLLRALARTALDQTNGDGRARKAAVAAVAASQGSRPLRAVAKPGLLIAGGIAGVTAASAAISAARQK